MKEALTFFQGQRAYEHPSMRTTVKYTVYEILVVTYWTSVVKERKEICYYAYLAENVSGYTFNHNYNKIVKRDWLSTALISALIGQFNRTVRVMPK